MKYFIFLCKTEKDKGVPNLENGLRLHPRT